MKDYNTITAELLKNAPYGINCYVSNDSYEDALQDIHCTGDVVKRVIGCHQLPNGQWVFFNTVGGQSHLYTIPVYLIVNQLCIATKDLLNRRDARDYQPCDHDDEDLLNAIQYGKWDE